MKWLDCLIRTAFRRSNTDQPKHTETSFFKIKTTNTSWVFVSAYTEEVDLDDLMFALLSLRNTGVPADKIFVFTDHPVPQVHLKHFTGIHIGKLDEIDKTYVGLIKTENVIATVLGHGGHVGIKSFSGKTIAPHPFVEMLKSPAEVKSVAVVLGQCYAGLFNYLNVRGNTQVCILGATNLHLSLATLTEVECSFHGIGIDDKAKIEWVANIFLMRFFTWIGLKEDVDGDGLVSILDGYRHAGALTNDELRKFKVSNEKNIEEFESELTRLLALTTKSELDLANIRRLQKVIDDGNEVKNLHQEPWVLHPDHARRIILDL